MNEKAIELFLANYNNQGVCKDLPRFLKTFNKEFKKTNTIKKITYYPWAVVERLFRMQGGKIYVDKWTETIEIKVKDFSYDENGVIVPVEATSDALFIRLKAEWQGEVEEEMYPIFDSQASKIIKAPNALDLNSAKQRGMVRLIARISGIGLDVFEQQEGQFEEDAVTKVDIKTPEKELEAPKPDRKVKKEVDKIIQASAMSEVVEASKPIEVSESDVMADFIKGTVPSTPIKVRKEQTPPKQPEVVMPENASGMSQVEKVVAIMQEKAPSFTNDTQEYADLLLEVRKNIREKSMQQVARDFVKAKNKSLLSELTFEELGDLNKALLL